MGRARNIANLLSTANGKIVGSNLDVSFENITDTGTEGTRIATGTSAQRGSTAGQLRFNSDTGLAEYYTGTEFKAIDSPPTLASVSPLDIATSSGGNETFTLTGGNFQSGATVTFTDVNGTSFNADTVTVNSSSSITAVKTRSSFSNLNEPYDIKVVNVSGLSAELENQINVDNAPSWSTASGSLGTVFSNDTGNHFTVSATDADGETVAYSETGGTVLSGQNLTLNSSTGVISGDPTDVSSDTTLSFTLRATAGSKTSDRAFTILLKPPTNYFGDGSDGSLDTTP